MIDSRDVATRALRAPTAAEVASMHASLDPDRTAASVALVLLDVTGARSCALWGLEGDEVSALAAVTAPGGVLPEFPGRRAPRSHAVERAVASMRPLHSRDETLAPRGVPPVMLVPLVASGTVVALAALDDVTATRGLEDVTGSAAVALANACAFEQTRADLAEAQRRVDELEALHAQRAKVEEAARGAALAQERDRIAAGLHDTAGQLFVAIRILARRDAEQLPPASETAARLHRLADLADQGKWEIDHAIDALALFPAARHGLAPALRSLGSSFQDGGDLDVIVDVYGRAVRLPAPAERALYRVVHESLANARHTRCSVVRVALTFDADGAHLEVAGDGTGLTGTIPDRGRPGTSDMRRAVAEAGGSFHIRSTRPHGVVIEASIPKERP